MKNKKATEDKLNELHGVIADELKAKLKSGEASATDFANAIRFLKDNGISVDVEAGDPTGILNEATDDLPFPTLINNTAGN